MVFCCTYRRRTAHVHEASDGPASNRSAGASFGVFHPTVKNARRSPPPSLAPPPRSPVEPPAARFPLRQLLHPVLTPFFPGTRLRRWWYSSSRNRSARRRRTSSSSWPKTSGPAFPWSPGRTRTFAWLQSTAGRISSEVFVASP